jgi:hypothetical protein
MTDNAINDKYVIPLLKQVTYRLDNRVPRIVLTSNNPNLVAGVDIGDDFVRLYENSDDYVDSDSSNGFNTDKQGVVFECYLPIVSSGNSSSIYFGTWDYGADIYYDDGYKIYFWNDGDNTDEYTYQEGDLFKMYLDGNTARFVVLHENEESSNIIAEETISMPCSNNTQYISMGFDSYDDQGQSYFFQGIKFYQTGRAARDGSNGDDGISLISGSGDPYPTLGNYGDIYKDMVNNTLWTNNGSWYVNVAPYVPSSTFALASNTSRRDIYSFGSNNSNVLITIIFAQSNTTRVPVSVVQIIANKSTDPESVVPPWTSIGTLPANVSIGSATTNQGTIYISSNSSAASYNYVTTKFQINY